jgi:hypothetical protein
LILCGPCPLFCGQTSDSIIFSQNCYFLFKSLPIRFYVANEKQFAGQSNPPHLKEKRTQMSILANAKNKATSGSVKAAFTNEDGAIDLASIMVGIIVIGLIGGVIAATVFAVIPWAQDNAAKQQLDSVASAESAYIGLSTDGGNQQNFVALTANKITAPAPGSDTLFDATGPNTGKTTVVVYTNGVSGNNAHYAAAVQSASGKWFKITDQKTQPTDIGRNAGVTTPAVDNEGGAAHTAATTLKDYAGVVAAV